jgi:hypothetical protein
MTNLEVTKGSGTSEWIFKLISLVVSAGSPAIVGYINNFLGMALDPMAVAAQVIMIVAAAFGLSAKYTTSRTALKLESLQSKQAVLLSADTVKVAQLQLETQKLAIQANQAVLLP